MAEQIAVNGQVPGSSPGTPAVPAGLQARGAALWDDLAAHCDLDGGGYHLALEACRIADRLDRLDAILNNDRRAWAHIRTIATGGKPTYKLVITGALAEARQQALVLRQIVAGLPRKGEDDDPAAAAFFAEFGVSP